MAFTVNQDFITKNGVIVLGTNSVSSSTGQTGALQAEGGAAVALNLIVGGATDLGSDTHVYGNLLVDGEGTFTSTLSVASTATVQDLTVNGNLNVAGGIQLTGALGFYGTATFYNQLVVTGTSTTLLGGNLEVIGKVLIDSTATATTDPDGALVILGGEYIGDNLIVAGLQSSLSTVSNNALYVINGVGIGDSLSVTGKSLFKDEVVFQAPVTFQGTATYVYSTNTYYTDNIIELHVPETDINDPWLFDDGRDIGLRFHYFNGASVNAALVLANDTKLLEFYSSGAEGVNTFTGGVYGGVKFGSLQLVTGIESDGTTSTGDLTVAGGVGIGGGLVVGQTSTFLSNISVSGNASAGSLTGQNFTITNVITFADATGTLQITTVGWDADNNKLIGTITYANTATNIDGGDVNYIPYQTAPGQTTFLPPGGEGTILTVFSGTLTWASASGSSVGFANTATNLQDGTTGSIPYQSAPGITAFDGTYFNYTGAGTTASLLTVFNLAATSTAVSSTIPKNNAIYNAGGLYSADTIWTAANLYVNDSATANFTGAGALHVTGGGYFGKNLYVASTLSGAITVMGGADFGKYVTIQDGTTATAGGAGALQVTGGVRISENLYVGTSATIGGDLYVGGDIYLDGVGLDTVYGTTATFLDVISTGTIQANNITVTGHSSLKTVTGTTGTFTNLNITSTITAVNAVITGTTTVNSIAGSNATFTNLTVTGVTSIGGISLSNATSDNLTVTNTLVVGNLITATNAVFTGTVTLNGQTTVNNTTTVNGKLIVTDTLDSTAKNNGSIVTYGGIGVGKSIVAGGAITAGTTLSVPGNVVPAIYSNNVLLSSYTSNTITGTGTVNLDTYSTDYRTARYTIQVVDGVDVHITELTVFHDGTNVYLDEYGTSTNHGELGVFSATLISTAITLTFKPTNATAMTIKVVRLSILA